MTPARLPDDVTAALARIVGAYVRATSQNELPPALRRFKSFRPKAMTRYRYDLADALDEEGFRNKVAQWLRDDRPRAPRRDVEITRLACERPKGWREQVGRLGGPAQRPVEPEPAPTDLKQRYDRAKDRAKQARADARKAREEARAAVGAERAKLAELRALLTSAQKESADGRRRAAAAERRADRERAGAERDRRKGRRAVEKAEAERDRARIELRSARREIDRLKTQLRDANHPAPSTGPKPAVRPTRAPPRRRHPLRAPTGRLGDEPATLEAWLDAPGVRLLVDGYNVTKSEGGFGDLDLEGQRRRLVEGVGRLARRKDIRAVVVFDGSQSTPPGTSRTGRGPARVEYSRPPETADDHLVALVDGLPADPVVVVTDDRDLRTRVGALGATVATSAQLLPLVR